MNFVIDSKVINQVSKNMGSLLNGKSTIPIFSGVLTVVQENTIIFTVSDGADTLVQRISKSAESIINTPGITVIPRDFFTTVKKMSGMIEVCTEGNLLTVKKGKTELTFTTMLADEYPKTAEQEPIFNIRLSGPAFKQIVDSTAFNAATSEVRPVLTGVNISVQGNSQQFVCTDSHRLGRIILNTTDSLEENQVVNQTIPAQAMSHAVKTFDLSKDVFIVGFKNMVALANGDSLYYSNLLEGNYPDTNRLIPQEFKTEIVVNRKEVHDTVLLLKEMTKDNSVKFTIDDSLFIKIAAKNELAKGNSEIGVIERIGEDLVIAFNAQYFLEALNSFEAEAVRISFTGAMRPFIIRSTDESEPQLQLILPVRTY